MTFFVCATPAIIPRNESTFSGNEISIGHKNVTYYCGAELNYMMKASADGTINITEVDYSTAQDRCSCNFNLSVVIPNVPAEKSQHIKVWNTNKTKLLDDRTIGL